MEKLLEIPQNIPKDKLIQYKFNIESDISKITEHEITI